MLKLQPALLFLSAAVVTSCATLRPDLATEAEEMRTIRAELGSSWSGVDAQVSAIEAEVRAFVARTVPADLGDVTIVTGGYDGALEATGVEEASADTRAWADLFVETANGISSRLEQELPAALEQVVTDSRGLADDVAEIRAAAEGKLAAGRENPLATNDSKAALEADYAAIMAESERIQELAGQVSLEAPRLNERVAAALQQFNVKLLEVQGAQ